MSFAAGFSMPATQALALWDDELKPFVEEKVTRDDNVFRISKDADPTTVIRSPSKGDTYRTTSLGANLDVPVSRQRVQAGYTFNDVRYHRFTDLDFVGHDARAIWLWQFGNDASGQLGYTETSALASFANIQTRIADRLKVRQAFCNGSYLFTPRWRIQAGVNELEQTNGDPAFQINDVNVLSTEAVLSYVTPANNSVGLGVRAEEGHFPKREPVSQSSVDNAYRQYSPGVVAEWTPTGASRVSARAGRVSRRYEQLPQRNFAGNVARVEYNWKPTGKFLLGAIAQRDISVYEDIRTSFVLVKGVTLRPTLSVTEKIDVSGTVDYSVRDFLGDPGLVSGNLPNRSDRVRAVMATVSYRPARNITLLMSAQRETRSSNIPFADYVANVVSASARLGF